jgi:NDP-sugar pyrophosphorylase family protein
MLPVAVLAGGLGTRVVHLTGPTAPKALLEVAGTAFIDLKLAELSDAGVTDVCMLVGYGAEALRSKIGDGAGTGLSVSWLEDGPKLLGTGGATARFAEKCKGPFWLTYGDTLLDVPMSRIEQEFLNEKVLAGMTVLENRDRWETSNVSVEDGRVTHYEKEALPGKHRFIDYGMLLFRSDAFVNVRSGSFDLTEILVTLALERQLAAYPVEERFHDVGNEAALAETIEFVKGFSSAPHEPSEGTLT